LRRRNHFDRQTQRRKLRPHLGSIANHDPYQLGRIDQLACPLVPSDWCHFAVRLPRTELHRALKDGTRNFEDEKFSYLVATRLPIQPAAARVIGRPGRPKGRVMLELCTNAGGRGRAVVHRSADAYREARSIEWGDEWGDQRS